MSSPYDTWVAHRTSCERCAHWFSAEPPDDKVFEPTCHVGKKIHRQMMKDVS